MIRYLKEGKAADAVAHYEQANQNDPYVKYKLAMAHKAAGNAEKAAQMLNEVANYNFNNLGYALVRKEVKDMLAADS